MARNRKCRCKGCPYPAISGYEHCDKHLTEIEVMTVSKGTAERLLVFYQQFSPEVQTVDRNGCYELAALGFEIATRFFEDSGQPFFNMVHGLD